MLNVMRENLRHLKWVLWVVAIAMVLSLGYFFSGSGDPTQGAWAARVNGNVISERDFLSEARAVDQQFGQFFGENPKPMVARTAIQRLIERELILQDANRLGIEASREDLAQRIRNDPSLKDETGQFIGTDRYVELLDARYPGGVTAFERAMANEIVIGRWTDVMTQSIHVDDTQLEADYRRQTDKTAVDYVVIPAADQEIDSTVSDEQARAWYDKHMEDYVRDETRDIRFAVIERDPLQQQIVVSDEEITASYEANRERYSHPAQRQARHILFRVEPDVDEARKEELRSEAQHVLDRLKAGEDFAELARAHSQDPGSAELGGDLGYFGPGDMVAPFETAVFEAQVGELAPIVETQFGLHLIQVTDAREPGVVPLDEVRDGIIQTLTLTRAEEQVAAEAQRLSAEPDLAERFAELVAAAGLELQSQKITADERLFDLGAGPDFVATAFQLEPGTVSPPLRTTKGLALLIVDGISPSQTASFEEAEAKVRSDLLNRRALDAAIRIADEAFAGRADLATVAKTANEEVQSSGDLSPGQVLPRTGGSSADLDLLLFADETEVGELGFAEVPAGVVYYEVTAREPFNSLAFEVARPDLRARAVDRQRALRAQAILQRMWETQEIVRNNELLERWSGTAGS